MRQMKLLDSVGEGEGGMSRENSIETCILSRVKQITSPGWMHETSAWGWCTGKTQRDGMEREAGGGIGMGNTCKSMADSCQCMGQKPLQYCKVISLQNKWKKKIRRNSTSHWFKTYYSSSLYLECSGLDDAFSHISYRSLLKCHSGVRTPLITLS